MVFGSTKRHCERLEHISVMLLRLKARKQLFGLRMENWTACFSFFCIKQGTVSYMKFMKLYWFCWVFLPGFSNFTFNTKLHCSKQTDLLEQHYQTQPNWPKHPLTLLPWAFVYVFGLCEVTGAYLAIRQPFGSCLRCTTYPSSGSPWWDQCYV